MSHEEQQQQPCGSPKAWQRFYMGYRERFVDDCCIELANGKVVRLAQAPSANSSKSKKQQQQLDKNADPALTGCTVWDGAVVLSQYLTAPGSPVLAAAAAAVAAASAAAAAAAGDFACSEGACVPTKHQQQQQQQQEIVSLELGAGTGAVSLSLLAAGAVHRAVITDIPDMTAHLQSNVQHNAALFNPARAVVKPLRWGEAADVKALAPPGPPFKLIVGSDLVYYSYSEATPHSRLLLLALQQLAGPESQIYLALSLHHNPQEVENFLRWAEEVWGFSVQRIQQQIPAEYRVADVLVVRLQLLDAGAAAAAAAQARAGTLVRGY